MKKSSDGTRHCCFHPQLYYGSKPANSAPRQGRDSRRDILPSSSTQTLHPVPRFGGLPFFARSLPGEGLPRGTDVGRASIPPARKAAPNSSLLYTAFAPCQGERGQNAGEIHHFLAGGSMVSAMRCFLRSTSTTHTVITSPTLTTSEGWRMKRLLMRLMCTSPS